MDTRLSTNRRENVSTASNCFFEPSVVKVCEIQQDKGAVMGPSITQLVRNRYELFGQATCLIGGAMVLGPDKPIFRKGQRKAGKWWPLAIVELRHLDKGLLIGEEVPA